MQKVEDKFNSRLAPGWFPYIECGKGWYPLISETLDQLEEADPNYVIHQIKEKFGELRVYISGNEAAQDIADKAGEKSTHICDVCGQEGSLRNLNGWLATTCEDHNIQQRWEVNK